MPMCAHEVWGLQSSWKSAVVVFVMGTCILFRAGVDGRRAEPLLARQEDTVALHRFPCPCASVGWPSGVGTAASCRQGLHRNTAAAHMG